jgi:hypothetical protein
MPSTLLFHTVISFPSLIYDLGRTRLVQHHIDTGSNHPFKEMLHRHSVAYLPVIDEHVQNMLVADVIEPAVSPWPSNVTMVTKKDGSLRFCVDYRRLNAMTRKDSYPLPRVENGLYSLGQAQFVSTLDLKAGYWQAEISEQDRDKTCFVTRKGTWRFKVLSFGLTNAPALFQRMTDLILAGLTWDCCQVHLDDVIVYGTTFQQHSERLATVLQRIKNANLKLHGKKCRFFQRETIFLGHRVTPQWTSPDPEKIRAVTSLA